jgi:hypothetical protein
MLSGRKKPDGILPAGVKRERGRQSPRRICPPFVSHAGLRRPGIAHCYPKHPGVEPAPHWKFAATEQLGINVLCGGHYDTETFGAKASAAHLSARFKVRLAERHSDPYFWTSLTIKDDAGGSNVCRPKLAV